MELRALDCETHRIGPGAVPPKLVCFSEGWYEEGGIGTSLMSTSDEFAKERVAELLFPGRYHLVLHNGAFDLAVIGAFWPDLVPMIWKKLELREVSDTMIREQLLNLSTFGRLVEMPLPDGSTQRILYALAEILYLRLGIDIRGAKEGDDIWRLNYDKLDGLPASSYPQDARDYACEDSEYTLMLHGEQETRIQSETGYASCSTETFHTAVNYALFQITMEGMRPDPEMFWRVKAEYEEQLTPEKMSALLTSGIMTPAIPPLPYKRCMNKATDQLAEWLDISPDDVRWDLLDGGLRLSLTECGFPFKKPETPTIKKAMLLGRIAAVKIADETRFPFERLTEVIRKPKGVQILERFAEKRGVDFVRTETEALCADKDVVADLAPLDKPDPGEEKSPLQTYQERQALQKIVNTELPRMCWDGEPAEKVHVPYKVLLETARTSSAGTDTYPSMNGQNVDPRARPIFVPEEGYVFCSADYKALELVCCAQTTYDLFGHSVHRDRINAGYDMHAYMGSILAGHLDNEWGPQQEGLDDEGLYHRFLGEKGTDLFKFFRKLAKPVGLGFASGLGSRTLVHHAKSHPYYIDLEEMGRERLDILEATNIVQFYAKKLYGMKAENFEWNNELIGIAMADHLRQIWLMTYPEMEEYFKWVKAQSDPFNERIYFGKDDEEGREGLCYTTPLGMHRAACSYTAVANGKALQSPGAEGFKHAIFDLMRAIKDPSIGSALYHGARFPNQIHDETLTELLEDDMHALAMDVQGIMENGMRKVIKDVDVEVEPALMRRWYKFAEPVYKNGILQIWEPEE